ncbi:hypothetical protein GTGU_04532 [Trabulsiella guamensis ATCC 49490]|uniref:Uncharacterized protein n=1 Tax=Trabulsiella guamensis ATCC 49490 TaxID=1005994 RepID=A0A084ZLD7_9ENTR|nr:hypothetical protein [Trabulsiella guamensis]KFB98281.1 hypothetical protein GTGU_04532 [Trabulsiella guamensis ATCC 49490]
MVKENNKFTFLVILLFFTHGFLYFFTGDIYNEENPIKLVKYCLLLLFALSIGKSLNFFHTNEILLFLFLVNFILTIIIYYSSNVALFSTLMFIFPLLFFFMHRKINYEKFIIIIKTTLWLAFAFSIFEFFLYQDLSSRFSNTGFRSISIFVNPNNFGIFVALSLSLIVDYSLRTQSTRVLIYWCISALCIALSGSMTAAGIYLFLLMVRALKILNNSLHTMKIKKCI